MKKNPLGLSDTQAKVLRFLSRYGFDDFGFYPFAPIARATGLNRREVRLACRALARKGLTEFGRGLCNEDGDFVGSGYRATRGACAIFQQRRAA